jgi:pyruvate kinase
MIRTKIVATLGPASSDVETLNRLLEEGLDVCRLNFSHGELAEHAKTLANVRSVAARRGQHIAVLGDLCGPKIRLGKIADQGGTGGMPINVGDTLVIQRRPIVGENGRVSSTYPQLVDDVKAGDRVLIEDGLLRFVITEKHSDEVRCNCTAGGVLKSSKGINLPSTAVSLPSVTDRDWECANWAIENGLDYLALSFVRRAEDIELLRRHLAGRNSSIKLIAKIEKPEAIAGIDGIIEVCDGLMIARGDLGVEMDVAQVPIIQKDLIRRCQAAGKPVIVATQMLQSMVENSSPTRAEVSDVANAIFDGADAVMLSGETSVGRFPVAAVHTMDHIADITETYLHSQFAPNQPPVNANSLRLSAAVARGVWQIVHDLSIKLIVVWSETGTTARIFSKCRFNAPILALSSNLLVLRQMALHYGVLPQEMAAPADSATLIEAVEKIAMERQLAGASDRIVIVAGSALGSPGLIGGIVIHTLGRSTENAGLGTIQELENV